MSLSQKRYMFGRQTVVLPDFLGYGITRFYSMFKTNLATQDHFARLKTVGGADKEGNVNFDGNGLFTNESIISGYGNVTTNLFQDWRTLNIYCQISGHSLTGSGASQKAIIGGNIYKVGINPAWICLGAGSGGYTTATPLPELNSGESFTVFTVVRNLTSADLGATIGTSATDSNRFSINCDRRSQKRHTIVRTSGNNYFADLSAQIDNSDFRILATTVNGATKQFKSYLNGVLQNTGTFVGSYVNDRLFFGVDYSNTNPLNGDKLATVVSSVELNGTDVLAVSNKLKTQFGL